MDACLALANQLDDVLAGRLELRLVLEQPAPQGGSLEACFHGLQHFLADSDIRAKDESYRVTQEGEMRKLIGLLRSSASYDNLATVDFLGGSHR